MANMKKHRVFLAINLPELIKKKLLDFQKDWADLPVRWTKKNNLHITLVFIGYVSNQEILEILSSSKQVCQKHQPFEIKLNRICLGPPGREARMIWIEGEKNSQLANLRNDLENNLLKSDKSGYWEKENRPFSPHITLARMRQWQWRQLAEKPQIEKEVSLNFLADSVELMESHLSGGGSEYAILESISLEK